MLFGVGLIGIICGGEVSILHAAPGQVKGEQMPLGEREAQVLSTYEWQVSSKDPAKRSITLIPTHEVFQIVGSLLKLDPDERATTSVTYRVRDLNSDGFYELVGTLDQPCSGCPTLLWVVSVEAGQLKIYRFRTHWGDVDRDVVDLNKDGAFEILARSVLAESNSHAEAVGWVDIYTWDESQQTYVLANTRFPDYYLNVYGKANEARLRQAEARDPVIHPVVPERGVEWNRRWRENEIADTQMALDKVQRVLKINPLAGYDRAVEWLKSPNRALRRNAVTVLEDIGDAEAVKHLQRAVGDPDPLVNQAAKSAIQRLRRE